MQTLRKRLTCLYTCTTGLILLLVMAAFLAASVREARQAQKDQFQLVWNSLSARFQSSNAFSHGFLAQTETDYQMILHIRENGTPFLYPGAWTPMTDREVLIQRARDCAEAEGVFMDQPPVSSSTSSSSLMVIPGDQKDRYYARILVAATRQGVRSICAVSYLPPIRYVLGRIIVELCLLAVLGIACLWLASWKFVGWSLKPVEESQKKQAQFIAAASHELRSPLAVLRSAVSAMSISPQKKDTLLPLMDSECIRMARLVDDMLLLASADARTWSLKRETVDMDTLLLELFEAFQPACREKGISLCLELPDQALPTVSGDPQRLRQILLVLLDNAAAFTPSGKSIWICAQVREKKRELALQVINEGRSIPQEARPYIFDRFYQADPSRSRKQHFGLGLSIARELAELHHGSISLEDDPQGRTCFMVVLPWMES